MEDRQRGIERYESTVRKNALHVALERLEAASPADVRLTPAKPAKGAAHFEIVHDQESALLQVRAKVPGFLVGHVPPVDLNHVRDRIVKQLRIIGADAVDLVDVRPEVADLVHD